MEVNNHVILDDTQDILIELRKQLELNGVKRFAKFIDSGKNIQTNCPFHKEGQERKPSFGINKNTGECHCFGCGWSGTLSEMISNCFGKDDFGVYGNKWLIRNFLSVAVESRPDIDVDFCRRKKITSETKKYISEQELDSYRYTHPYMYKRKLTDEIIDLFDIGYDKSTDCITFPNRDINGNCLFIARRSVKTKFFNYPQDVEKPVYGLYELRKISKVKIGTKRYPTGLQVPTYESTYPSEIIICESMIDALTCWVYGRYAVALNGTGNENQFKTLRNMPNRKFILATDMDEAGLKARERIRQSLGNKLVTEYVWDINVAKDINDMNKEYFDSLKEVF